MFTLNFEFWVVFLKRASPNYISSMPQNLNQPYLGWENDTLISATEF